MAYRSDYDSAWKNALEAYFPQFMALFSPALHARIDWRRAPEFLDKELQAIARGTPRGRRHVDKLVRVHLLGGRDTLILIHVEIQGRLEKAFPQRMFIYHVRLREKRPQYPLVSLAVYTGRANSKRGGADQNDREGQGSSGSDGWSDRKDHGNGGTGDPRNTVSYRYENWGCSLEFTFPVLHLEDWRARVDQLRQMAPRNPFAVVILAQLQANATRDGPARLAGKTELVRHLSHWGFKRDTIGQLFFIIDAMLALPQALEPAFEEAVVQIEKETNMTYVTSIERVRLARERAQGREEGREEGRANAAAETLTKQVEYKFGALPTWARLRIDEAGETDLGRWSLNVLDAQRIEDVFN